MRLIARTAEGEVRLGGWEISAFTAKAMDSSLTKRQKNMIPMKSTKLTARGAAEGVRLDGTTNSAHIGEALATSHAKLRRRLTRKIWTKWNVLGAGALDKRVGLVTHVSTATVTPSLLGSSERTTIRTS